MNRPFVNGNREQTNNFTVDGLDVNETIDNRVAYQPSPDAVAEISVETNNYAADIGNVGGAVVSSVIKSGHEPVPRQRLRVLPQQRLRREHLGEQPLAARRSRSASSTSSAARSAVRSSTNSLFFFADYQGSRQDAPGLRHGLGGARGVAARRPVERDDADPRSADRTAVPGQPDSGRADQRDRARAAERPGELPAAQPDVPGGITGNYVGDTPARDPRPPGRRPPRLEPVDQQQVLRPLLVRHATKTSATSKPFPLVFTHAQRPAVLQRRLQLEPRLRAVDRQRVAGRLQPHHRHQRDGRLGGRRRRQRPLRHRRRPADRRALADRLGQRPHAARDDRPPTRTPSPRPTSSTRS